MAFPHQTAAVSRTSPRSSTLPARPATPDAARTPERRDDDAGAARGRGDGTRGGPMIGRPAAGAAAAAAPAGRRAAPRGATSSASRSSPARWRRSRSSARRACRSSSTTPTRSSRRSASSSAATPRRSRLLRDAGADVDGERVRFPRGMCRQIVQATAPRQFTQYARNPRRQRRDRRDAHGLRPELRLAVRPRPRQRPALRHDRGLPELREARLHVARTSTTRGGTVCEPVDVPVNKRHLDMVYSHIRYSDKPFMGSVTAPERARDTVEMARHRVRRRLPRGPHRHPRR